MAAANSEARTTPAATVSFPAVFKMTSYQGGKPSYSLRAMFDKSNKEQMDFLKLLVADMEKVRVTQWPDEKTRPRIPMVGHDKSPIKDGDKNCNQKGIPYREKNPELIGHYFFNCAKYNDPLPVVDRNMEEIIDSNTIYSGCKCKINVNTYARLRSDNQGVSIGLNGVQFWADGERLGGGGPDVDDMFESSGSGIDDAANYDGSEPFSDTSSVDDVLGGGNTDPMLG